jgi:hypothetical protein
MESTTTVYTISNGAAFSPFLVSQTAVPGLISHALAQPTTPPDMPRLGFVNDDRMSKQAQPHVSGMIIIGPNDAKVTALARQGPTGGVVINGINVPIGGEFTLANGLAGKVDSRGFLIVGKETHTPSNLDLALSRTTAKNDAGSYDLYQHDLLTASSSQKRKKSSGKKIFSLSWVIYMLNISIPFLCMVLI